ncbi:hypothetical protein SAMN05660484_02204 [Eubacterium ruminantium]|uniref:Uncharacterized protein n=1 Tax=Eubacterium ruminantium TaxID=42322 RepID=A0A1T4Q5U2_9FIRM|nr:hypothetical protein [Eubacterium ruminantium]SCW63884.1 hypothetical protein SAMN05660484_02204 [Eubacterium ruminantium]SDN31766.1 hypothetical protein SAMN04490370_11666 [Eubacterium ruminantium]SJZ99132.1 hypothetical protein SAMN02745110_02279 [Eubacterium ruminantium]
MVVAYTDSNDCNFAVKFENEADLHKVEEAVTAGIRAWYSATDDEIEGNEYLMEVNNMNGIDLINNLIDELNRARNYISEMSDYSSNSILEDELVDDIRRDLDRYYDYADSFDEVLQDIEIEE